MTTAKPISSSDLAGRETAAPVDPGSVSSGADLGSISPYSLEGLTRLANELFEQSNRNAVLPEPLATGLMTPGLAVDRTLPDLNPSSALRPFGSVSREQSVGEFEVPVLFAPGHSPSIRGSASESNRIDPYSAAQAFDDGGAPPHESYYFLQAVQGSLQSMGGSLASEAIRLTSSEAVNLPSASLDIHAIRRDFPILAERVQGRPLVWLDNAATTQKPRQVIERIRQFYEHENSNIHRGAHELAARSTDAYEAAREKVRRFINAASIREIVFVRGGTEAINLVAKSWGSSNLRSGDEIVLTQLEHHANIVPWQQLAQQTGAVIRVVPVDSSGQIVFSEYEKLLSSKTRLVAFTQISNALGTITPAREMVALAHGKGAKVLIDAAQSVAHSITDVQSLDCDWLVFSGHKMFAPTGIGVLYGKEEILNSMPPWQGGGNMIQDVTFERTSYQLAPARFEAGTGNIADAVGLGAAIDYLQAVGMASIERYEQGLMQHALTSLSEVPGLQLIGSTRHKAGALSFVIEGLEPMRIAQLLNQQGIAVRAGHHCAQPILRRFGLEATVRPSLALYNTYTEVDFLASTLKRIVTRRNHF